MQHFSTSHPMKQQEVYKKIGGILKELNEQYEYLGTVDEPLNELELELFLANSHFLTDHMVILSKLNAQAVAVKKSAETGSGITKKDEVAEPAPTNEEPKYFEPLVQSAIPPKNGSVNTEDESPAPHIDLEAGLSDDTFSYIREEPETIRHELILDEADFYEDDEPVGEEQENIIVEDVQHQKTEPPVVPIPKPVAKQPAPKPAYAPVKEDMLTINERMSAQLGERDGVAGKLNLQPITDLKAAINLNDKMLYVKDLFNGYSLAYSEAIEILNRFTSFAEAEVFLKKNYVAKNNWESKPETTTKFYTLLKRRYA
jgi:hypothetical protein